MERPIRSNPGHIPQEAVSQSTGTPPASAWELCREQLTRAYFEKEINNHTLKEKKLFGKGMHVAKTLVTASRSQFVSP